MMKSFLYILPVSCLVAYSQIIVKWQSLHHPVVAEGLMDFLIKSISSPIILSAYVSALFASFAWLFVVTKLPLSTAFPIYIGVIFILVVLGGWLFLNEQLNFLKLVAIFLIFSGVVIGLKS